MEYIERMKRRQTYLNTVKAGDTVTILSGYENQDAIERKVARITKKWIVVEYPMMGHDNNERAFKADGGREVSPISERSAMQIIDPEWATEHSTMLAAHRLGGKLRNVIQDFNVRNFGTEDNDLLQAVVDAMEAANKTREERSAARMAEWKR